MPPSALLLLFAILPLPSARLSAVDVLCETADCVALSATLTQNMNLTADPCDNFYEFACGGFARRFRYDVNDLSGKPYTDAAVHMTADVENRLYEILIDVSQPAPEDATVREATELARSAFNNCVTWGEMKYSEHQSPASDTAQRSAAVRNFNSLLSHLLPDAKPPASLEQLLARTSSMGFSTVFGLSAPEEFIPTNATKLFITVSTFNYTIDPSLWRPMLRLLASRNVTLSKLLFGISAEFQPEPEAIAAVAKDLGRLVDSVQASNASVFQGSLEELDRELARNSSRPFSWPRFLRELVPALAKVVDASATVVIVDNFPLLQALLRFFNAAAAEGDSLPPRQAFLVLDAMLELSDLLPLSLKDSRPVKDSPLASLIMTRPRGLRRQCAEAAHKLMEPAVELLYRRLFFPGGFKEIERLIVETKEATIAGMREQAWISPADKAKMIDKVRAMRHFVGYRQLTLDQVAAFYRSTGIPEFNRTRTTDLGYILGLALKSYARRHLDLLVTGAAQSPFQQESPFSVNAFNDPDGNAIVFPLGILTPPVFSVGYPDFALYGGFASLVGHEIGHGFADQWLKSQETASALLQLEASTEAEYLRRVQCVRDDFQDAAGNATLTDDIADIVGLSVAHRAYVAGRGRQTNLRPAGLSGCAGARWSSVSLEQLFFVHSAQMFCTRATPEAIEDLFRREAPATHSPGPARVNGMARSSAEFAAAFRCHAGSRMNPPAKCKFW